LQVVYVLLLLGECKGLFVNVQLAIILIVVFKCIEVKNSTCLHVS
jgi:hypothetical protein